MKLAEAKSSAQYPGELLLNYIMILYLMQPCGWLISLCLSSSAVRKKQNLAREMRNQGWEMAFERRFEQFLQREN